MALSSEDIKAIRSLTEDIVERVADRKQEELAVLIGNSFRNVEESFQKVEQRFQGVEQQLDQIGEKLDKHTQQIADIKLTQADHGLLLHRIDRRPHDQQQRLDQHEVRLRRLEKHQGLRPLPGTSGD